MKILILNCYSRNALSIINSLDPGYEIIGGAAKKDRYALFRPDKFLKSRRIKAIIRYTDPKEDQQGFKNDILEACEQFGLDAIIPTGTTTTNCLSRFKHEIIEHVETTLVVEDYDVLSRLSDKWNTVTLCRELGVPVPRTILCSDRGEVLSWACDTGFPVLVKPRVSYAAKGVNVCESKHALIQYLNTMNAKNQLDVSGEPALIVQEVIKGELHDVTACSKDGSVVSMLSQQRLVALYDFGGGGIVNKTTYEPVPMGYATDILKHLKWNGVLLFDFIKDTQGNYYLLECNPKIWGTTQLTIEAGLNVAQQLIDLFVLGKDIGAIKKYDVGVVYKWWFPECLFHWFHRPRTVGRIVRRVANTLRSYDAQRSVNNLRCNNISHLLGMVLDRAEL